MQRICFTLRVKPERLEQYRAVHRDVWPEMQEALRRHGWHNYSLFLRDDGLLIGYCETPDFARAIAGMQDEPVNARWQASVADLFEDLASDAADRAMAPLPEVFHLD
ncbi:MAG: L-rhamnose mutarotase [Planctomycetes bacterium]|nr:L-rhamnose mutarotase [Planctomycetota bacterium]MCB9891793.1 L-rhamnose mutarotase [Planctomycetota bacterium]